MHLLWRFLRNQVQRIVAWFHAIVRAIAAEAARQRRKIVFRFLLETSEIDKQELYEFACQYMRNGKEIDADVLQRLVEPDRFVVRVQGQATPDR